MGLRHLIGWVATIVGAAAVAGGAYYIGRMEGQKDVVKRVKEIREKCEIQDVEVEKGLDKYLTDKKGKFIMTASEKNDMSDKMLCVATLASSAVLIATGMTSAAADKVNLDNIEKITSKYNEEFNTVVDQSINSYNEIVDQTNRVRSCVRALPEGVEKDAMMAYEEGLSFGRMAMDNGVEGWMRSNGYVRVAHPGDPTRY